MKKAFITGITGQDGFYLASLLLQKGYQIHGTVRRSSSFNTERIDGLISEFSEQGLFNLYYSDLLDSSSLNNLIRNIEPDEIYNLAAQSHVKVSFQNPVYTTQTGTLGPVSMLESIRNLDYKVKYYQASSSEMYGETSGKSIDEKVHFNPLSPYAAAKVFAHNLTKIYREAYDLFCVNGILFNHESPYRGETFVTRKITRAVGRISVGIQSQLTLGNLEAVRDWGFAGDYVEGMWRMLNYQTPDDYILATGQAFSVKEFAEKAFDMVSLNWEDHVQTSEKYLRPNEVNHLLGDASKAKKELNWQPKTSFDELVRLMVDSDIELAKREKVLIENKLIKPTWEFPVRK